LFAGFLKVATPLFIMILPGVMARALYPDLEKANLVYPMLMFDLLPVGLLGLVLAGLLAAMMSSIDSALNSASTLVTMDFFRKLRPRTTEEGLMWVGRGVTFVFMILAALWAPEIDKYPTLWEYLQNALSYIAPPIVALFTLGVFWRRGNAQGAVAALIVGVLAAAFFLLFRAAEWMPEIHFLYMAMILYVLSSATLVVVSLLSSPPPPHKTETLTWTRRSFQGETETLKKMPAYANYRYQSMALLVFIGIILAIFW